jgi:chromate reductase
LSLKILAISGSLRSVSFNHQILLAAAEMAPPDVKVEIFEGLAAIPSFNPDLDREPLPTAVKDFKKYLDECDGVLISSPEYAFGVPGSLKNALDWAVGSNEFEKKPVSVITVSATGGEQARTQLERTLKAMSAEIIEGAGLFSAVARKAFDSNGHLVDPAIADLIRTCLMKMVDRLRKS